jgi:hypothetical protein
MLNATTLAQQHGMNLSRGKRLANRQNIKQQNAATPYS